MNEKNPRRLLIILNRFVIGGQAVDTLPLAYFLQQDFEVLIVYGEKEKDEVEPRFLLDAYPGLQLKKVRALRRSVNPLVDLAAFVQLIAIVLRYKPAIVHTHGAKSGLLGRLAAFLCGVPVIVHTFHGHLFHSYFNRTVTRLIIYLERWLGKITSGAVVLSASQRSDVVDVFRIFPSRKVAIIPLGFDTYLNDDRHNLRTRFRQQYQLGQSDVAVGIVGRLVPVKDHSFFIRVINKILKANAGKPPAFFIIGDGELRGNIEEQLTTLQIAFSTSGISNNVRVVFTSWLSNIAEVMSGLDIVVLTSLNEGTPLSIIEAQAFERPLVATNVGGVQDTMIDGKTGFYVEREDIRHFTEKLMLLIADEGKRKAMGLAGRRFVAEKFSKQREIAMTSEFYFSLLQRRGVKG